MLGPIVGKALIWTRLERRQEARTLAMVSKSRRATEGQARVAAIWHRPLLRFRKRFENENFHDRRHYIVITKCCR